MAFTFNINTEESLTLEEYQERVQEGVDFSSAESLAESAILLKKLANNRSFLVEHINQELSDLDRFQPLNMYTAQTFMLATGKNYAVRANIWEPPSMVPEKKEAEDKLFLYRVPHDHNFSFLTVGYFGTGYETEIYEYESEKIVGSCGEHVELHFLERTSLPTGKIMMYRASRDVHSQEHAKDFSISLNLLATIPSEVSKTQYLFDLESSSIRSYAQAQSTGNLMLCRLAKHIGNAKTKGHLERILSTNGSERLRLAAYESLAALEPAAAEGLWSGATQDRHPYVRQAAHAALIAAV